MSRSSLADLEFVSAPSPRPLGFVSISIHNVVADASKVSSTFRIAQDPWHSMKHLGTTPAVADSSLYIVFVEATQFEENQLDGADGMIRRSTTSKRVADTW